MDKENKRKLFKKLMIFSVALIILLLVIPIAPVQAADSDGDGTDDAVETTLLNKYAPNLYFKAGKISSRLL